MSLCRRAGSLTGIAAAGAAALAVSLSGCAKFDAALGQQWIQVSFTPSTTVAQLKHIRQACSHIPNIRPYAFPRQHSVISLMNSVRFNTTSATDANIAQLQICLQKFPQVQGLAPGDTGGEGG